MNIRSTYGALASVRKTVNEKLLVCFEHNECIFKKNSLSNKPWVGSNE